MYPTAWIKVKNANLVANDVWAATFGILKKHSYDAYGYCTNHGELFKIVEKKATLTAYAIKDDVVTRSTPYATGTIVKKLKKDEAVNIVAYGTNAFGSIWAKTDSGSWIFKDRLAVKPSVPVTPTPAATSDLSGTYTIQSAANSDYVLNVLTTSTPKSADSVTMYKFVKGDIAQSWTLKKSGDAYIITSGSTPVLNVYRDGKAKSGDKVNVYKPVSGDNNQLWVLESAGDNQYVLRSKSNPDCVLTAAGTSNKANVTVQTYTGADTQKWKLAQR
jgi:hypothetical protein